MDRVIAQVIGEHGGEERCPWLRAICEGKLQYSILHVSKEDQSP